MTAPGSLALAQAIRTRLLGFVPADGAATLAATLADITLVDAPDDVTAPYGVLRVTDAPGTTGDSMLRKEGQAELMLYGRRGADRATLQGAADVAEAALWNWVDYTTGVLVMTAVSAQPLPPYAAPADRELIAIRVAATWYWYPSYLDQYATPAA